MKHASEPTSGKYRFARLGPIMSFIVPYQKPMKISKKVRSESLVSGMTDLS